MPGDRGVYLQLGINPGYTVAPQSAYPLTISMPVTLGLSGHKYYEFGTTRNPTFGYVQFGPVFSVPLAFTSEELWHLDGQGAAEFVFLGDTLKPLNDNDVFKPIGRIGIAAVY